MYVKQNKHSIPINPAVENINLADKLDKIEKLKKQSKTNTENLVKIGKKVQEKEKKKLVQQRIKLMEQGINPKSKYSAKKNKNK